VRDFTEKKVYIVGGSSGIGLSIARALSARGAHVVIFARAKDRLDRAREQVAACAMCEPQRFSCMQVDVCNGDEVQHVMSEAVSQLGAPGERAPTGSRRCPTSSSMRP